MKEIKKSDEFAWIEVETSKFAWFSDKATALDYVYYNSAYKVTFHKDIPPNLLRYRLLGFPSMQHPDWRGDWTRFDL